MIARLYLFNLLLFRKALKASNVPRFHHSAVFLGDMMLVFGGNSHNGTLGAQSNQPCFATDFVAYDIGTSTLNNNEQITLIEGPVHSIHS